MEPRLNTISSMSVFRRPFVKRFTLCYRTVVCLSVCPICPVCNVAVLRPNRPNQPHQAFTP